ncbi:hypothetical protein CDIK_3956 [Cucumispora dikerogammari]|nr:hypothetical protein CDIK_3956 [Cucumispora dikerogammari]
MSDGSIQANSPTNYDTPEQTKDEAALDDTNPVVDRQARQPRYNKIAIGTRKRIIDAFQAGTPRKILAEYEQPPKNTINSIIAIFQKTGRLYKKKKGGLTHHKITLEIKEFINQEVDADCTVSLRKICNRVLTVKDVTVSTSTVFNCLRDLHYSLKILKSIPVRRNEADVIESRFICAQEFLQIEENYPPSKILFLDEVRFNVTMRVKHGRSLVGQTPISSVTTIKSKNISICSVMSRNKVIFKCLNRNAYNTSGFLSYLQELFTFLNSEGLDNCILIMDNVAYHKSDVIKTEFEEKGYRILFLSAYSSSLNPIEMFFYK